MRPTIRGPVSAGAVGAFATADFWKLFTWNQDNEGFTLVGMQFTRSLHPQSENPNCAPEIGLAAGQSLKCRNSLLYEVKLKYRGSPLCTVFVAKMKPCQPKNVRTETFKHKPHLQAIDTRITPSPPILCNEVMILILKRGPVQCRSEMKKQ